MPFGSSMCKQIESFSLCLHCMGEESSCHLHYKVITFKKMKNFEKTEGLARKRISYIKLRKYLQYITDFEALFSEMI